MPRPVHFEIQAESPDRAIKFYTGLFAWKFAQWGQEKYWLITTGEKGTPGIDGGLLPRPVPGTPAPMAAVNAFVCTVDVADLDAIAIDSRTIVYRAASTVGHRVKAEHSGRCMARLRDRGSRTDASCAAGGPRGGADARRDRGSLRRVGPAARARTHTRRPHRLARRCRDAAGERPRSHG